MAGTFQSQLGKVFWFFFSKKNRFLPAQKNPLHRRRWLDKLT
jgi:hypothetical protein